MTCPVKLKVYIRLVNVSQHNINWIRRLKIFTTLTSRFSSSIDRNDNLFLNTPKNLTASLIDAGMVFLNLFSRLWIFLLKNWRDSSNSLGIGWVKFQKPPQKFHSSTDVFFPLFSSLLIIKHNNNSSCCYYC